MSNLTPSNFATPGAPLDTLPTITEGVTPPAGANGRAAVVNRNGQSVLGAQARMLALEGRMGNAHQTALFVNGTAAISGDGVNCNADLSALLASQGFDLRIKYQYPAVAFSAVIGMGRTLVTETPGNAVFRFLTGGTQITYVQFFSATAQFPGIGAGLSAFAVGDWVTVRVTRDFVSGQNTIFRSIDDGATWIHLAQNATSAGVALYNDPTAILATWAPFNGAIAWAELRNLAGTVLASVDFRRPWRGTTYTDPQNNTWTFRRGGGAWINQNVPTQISQRIEFTTSGSLVVPQWATSADIETVAGGAGGGGGGSANSAINQVGGSGGAGNIPIYWTGIPVVPTGPAITVTIGAAGQGGAGGAAGGAAGVAGTVGGNTIITVPPGTLTIMSLGGGLGIGSAANSTTAVSGRMPNAGNQHTPAILVNGVHSLWGAGGGSGGQAYGLLGVTGGSGGGASTATVGGGGGFVDNPTLNLGGTAGASTNGANGMNGATAMRPGFGGGGGGGGAPGGTGGNGGNGAPGRAIITFHGVA